MAQNKIVVTTGDRLPRAVEYAERENLSPRLRPIVHPSPPPAHRGQMTASIVAGSSASMSVWTFDKENVQEDSETSIIVWDGMLPAAQSREAQVAVAIGGRWILAANPVRRFKLTGNLSQAADATASGKLVTYNAFGSAEVLTTSITVANGPGAIFSGYSSASSYGYCVYMPDRALYEILQLQQTCT